MRAAAAAVVPLFHALFSACVGALIRAPPSRLRGASMRRAAASIEEANARATRTWREVAVAAPRLSEATAFGDGAAPAGLAGTWYVNGLASCRVGERLVHPFEAHGFVKAFSFDGKGGATLTTRFVETPVQQWETRLNRPLVRGAMSNVAAFDKFPDHLLNAASPSTRAVAQLAVRKWAGKFFASTDNAPWYALDPNTLETKGIETMNGALNGRDPLAHTRLDRRRQRLVAAAATFDAFNDKTTTDFWEFDADGRELSRYEDTDQSYVVHDFAITEEHYVLPVSPIKFDLDNIPDFALGKAPATDLFAFDAARHGELKLLPRFGGEAVRVDLGAFGCIFHLGPCWIDEAGRLVAHVLLFEKYDGLGTAMGFDVRTQAFDPIPWSRANGGPTLRRIVADAATGEVLEATKLSDTKLDMPTFHPGRDGLPNKVLFGTAGARPDGWFPFNALVKYDLEDDVEEVWHAGDDAVTSEPYFVPRDDDTDDGEGWVLSLVHDVAANATQLHVFDSARFGSGPVWTARVGELWPWNVHTTWVPPS